MSRGKTETEYAFLRIADQLTRWADQSKSYGWSTLQVEPMRRLATQIYESLTLNKPECILCEMEF